MPHVYETLHRVRFLRRSFTAKFLFIAFVGIHIPLVVTAGLLALNIWELSPWQVVLILLLATLVATGLSLQAFHKLLWPISTANEALKTYQAQGTLPNLPVHFVDEAGALLNYLQTTTEKISKTDEQNRYFITLLSHDLRTPCAQVVSLANALSTEQNIQVVREYAGLMETVGNQLLQQMNNMLVLLRTDADQVVYETTALQPIVNQAIQQIGVLAIGKNIEMLVQLPPGPLMVCTHTTLLQQAIYNLLTNAIKFSKPGGRIWLSVRKAEKGMLEVAVKDEGIGFEPEFASKLFDRFTKQSRTGTAGEPSTGVGLYLVKRIIRSMQGKIEAYSEGKGKGAVFTICIPQDASEPADEKPAHKGWKMF